MPSDSESKKKPTILEHRTIRQATPLAAAIASGDFKPLMMAFRDAALIGLFAFLIYYLFKIVLSYFTVFTSAIICAAPSQFCSLIVSKLYWLDLIPLTLALFAGSYWSSRKATLDTLTHSVLVTVIIEFMALALKFFTQDLPYPYILIALLILLAMFAGYKSALADLP